MIRGVGPIIYKETIHALRDKRSLFLMILWPGAQLILFGFAVDFDVKNIPTVVYNLDGRREARDLIDSFGNSGYFDIVGNAYSDKDMNSWIVRVEAKVAIKIPPDYTDKLVLGKSAKVQILIDGSDSTVAMQALNVSNAIALRKSLAIVSDVLDQTEGEAPVEARPRVKFNPDMKTANFMVPGLVAIIMQLVTMFFTAFAVVKEKENGTLEQLMVTPVSRLGLMAGKIIPYAVIGSIETFMVLCIMYYVFGVSIAGSLVLLGVFSLIFLFTALGTGLLISTVAENQMQAIQISVVFVMPSVMLSGFVFPLESMPLPIWAVGQLVPATYFIRILRGIILRGAGIQDIWCNGLCLAVMGLAVLAISTARFHKTLG